MSDQISLSVALTLAGMLAGGALTYGALRQTVADLRQTVVDLKGMLTDVKTEVTTLRGEVTKLSTEVEIMKRVEERVGEITARHETAPPSRNPRDPRRE